MWDAFWNVPQESPGLAFGPSHGHMVVFAFHPLDRPGKHERKGARLWKGLRGKERGVVRTVRKRLHVPALGAALHRPCGWLRTAHVRVCVCVLVYTYSVDTFLPCWLISALLCCPTALWSAHAVFQSCLLFVFLWRSCA